MKNQSCKPCAKRKVRCDREEPCSNCKRRKQDTCEYPEISPTERIRELEALVISLKQESEHSSDGTSQRPHEASSVPPPPPETYASGESGDSQQQHAINPMIVREDGEPVYLESFSWHSWSGKVLESNAPLQTNAALQTREGNPRIPLMTSTGSGALQSIILQNPGIDMDQGHPNPQDAIALWDIFLQRAHPMMKISFDWELDRIRANSQACLAPNARRKLDFGEHAFLFAVYLLSVTNLSAVECTTLLSQSKSVLLSNFQMLCEQALAGSNFLGASDLTTIQALTMYITAGIDRLETKSLWSLMGMVIRNSERCGLHRDGALLGLSPYETERRRRVWWQLQHIDLALAVKAGSMSLTLSAAWDTRLPLNIEDEDMTVHMREAPKEREGLTSLSNVLWTYWVMYEQRSFCRPDGSRLGFSWAAERSLSRAEKDAFIDRLEAGLNKRYVQYCDPIRPRDMLVQICARAFICCMRRVSLHPVGRNGRLSDLSEDHRNRLLDICIRCLEYDVALHSNPSINYFRARLQGYFQWAALVYVLVEARRLYDTPKAEKIWALLSDVYATNTTLSELQEDRRKSYAVELMSVAWETRKNYLIEYQQRQIYSYGSPPAPRKPAFLVNLEDRLLKYIEAGNFEAPSKRKLGEADLLESMPTRRPVPTVAREIRDLPVDNVGFSQYDLDAIAEIDFDAIDWSFWEALPPLPDPSTMGDAVPFF